MRAKSAEYYNSLTEKECLDFLELHSLYHHSTVDNNNKIKDLKVLQDFVRNVQTTRHFLIWWDHAEVANYTYILFNFQLIYNPAVYHSENVGVSERQLQKIIEVPQLYFIGLSRSTTECEESYSEMRVHDLESLSFKIKDTINGNVFTDVYKFTTGDTPARNSESGQNKGGHYPMATLPLNITKFERYHDLCGQKHMTIEEQRAHANKGGYYNNIQNYRKNLQSDKNSIEIAKLRLNKTFSSQKEASNALKDDLHGRRHQHTLLINNPYQNLAGINIDNLEIMPAEPLHDLKGLVKKSLEMLPGSIDKDYNSEVLEKFRQIIVDHGDEVYLLKDNHSAETVFKFLIGITLSLESKLFPEGLIKGVCNTCGSIFRLNDQLKCERCLFMGYYRVLLEIHIFGYKDNSKRNGQSVLRLYNLVYLLFYYIRELQSKFPNSDIKKIIHNVYFVNIVYYLPICFQLVSCLSFHAGRHEADFQNYKDAIKNYSNRHHFSSYLLLNADRRLAVQKFHTDISHTQSQVSKQINKYWDKSPPLDIEFHVGHIDSKDINYSRDFYMHLNRIACFLISNDDNRYIEATSDCLKFRVMSCDCVSSTTTNDCISCKSLIFPPYPIHNIYNSSIAKIIKFNHEVAQQIIPKIFVEHRINFPNLASLIDKQYNDVIGTKSVSSIRIIENIKPSSAKILEFYIKSVLDKPYNYCKIKSSKTAQCLALFYDNVDDNIIQFDETCKNMQSRQSLYKNRKNLNNDVHYYRYHKSYIRQISLFKPQLEDMEGILQNNIDEVGHAVDSITEPNCNLNDFLNISSVKQLKKLQIKKIALLHIINNFQHEVNANKIYDE